MCGAILFLSSHKDVPPLCRYTFRLAPQADDAAVAAPDAGELWYKPYTLGELYDVSGNPCAVPRCFSAIASICSLDSQDAVISADCCHSSHLRLQVSPSLPISILSGSAAWFAPREFMSSAWGSCDSAAHRIPPLLSAEAAAVPAGGADHQHRPAPQAAQLHPGRARPPLRRRLAVNPAPHTAIVAERCSAAPGGAGSTPSSYESSTGKLSRAGRRRQHSITCGTAARLP